ncbi:MAG: OmpH family outer membrane protein [Candidatus Omnitrophica bacterium]|nr:OmpH family outer membrane protein [Candidatus Omnitrophota bacterium]
MKIRQCIMVGMAVGWLVGAGSPTEAAMTSAKIAYINVGRLFDGYQKTKESDKALEAKASSRGAERDKLVADVKKLKEGMEVLTDKAKETRRQEFEAKAKALQEFDRTVGEALRRERDGAAKDIFKDMEVTIKEYAAKEGYDLIVNDQALLYGSTPLDVTDPVLKMLNDRYATKK